MLTKKYLKKTSHVSIWVRGQPVGFIPKIYSSARASYHRRGGGSSWLVPGLWKGLVGVRARIIISLAVGGNRRLARATAVVNPASFNVFHKLCSSLHLYEPDTEAKAAAAAQNARLNRRLVKRSHPSLSYFFLSSHIGFS